MFLKVDSENSTVVHTTLCVPRTEAKRLAPDDDQHQQHKTALLAAIYEDVNRWVK